MNPQAHEEEAYLFSMQVASACVLPMALKAVIELNILSIIDRAGPGAYLSPEEIAAHIPTKNPQAPAILDRILRLLASHAIINCYSAESNSQKHNTRYGLAPVSKFLTPNEDGVSMAPMVLFLQDKVLMESMYNLKDSLLEGSVPFHEAHGSAMFEYAGKDSRFNDVLNCGMSDNSTITMKKILEIYQGFDDVSVLVDVGGGTGSLLKTIISKHPSIKGINFDLPHVISKASIIPGVKHVEGDMFESVPSGDAIFMKWILHSWSDEVCLKLLKNCWNALAEKGKVIIMEGILPDTPNTSREAQILFNVDMFMLALKPGGHERTEKEFKSLAKGSGFSGFSKVVSAFDFSIMEFHK